MSKTSRTTEAKDEAMDALISQFKQITLAQEDGTSLWVADEHPLPENFFTIAKQANAVFLSNRFDQYQLAKKQAIPSYFSDIDLSQIDAPNITQIFFRIAKERPLVHRLINEAWGLLPTEGTLWISGFKNQGIKTLISRAEARFGCIANIERGPNQRYLAEITRHGKSASEIAPDSDYPTLREIKQQDTTFWSKPGLYGWDKVDHGSKYLMEYLADSAEGPNGKKVLDLGCGYGYLSLRAKELGAIELVATDNCAAAIIACKKNLEDIQTTNVTASAVPSDAGSELEEDFDVILCNPPFHQGFSTTPDLHRKFLFNTKRLLRKGGSAWFVVNQFLNIETLGQDAGLAAKEVSRSKSYKIIRFSA